MGLARLQVRPRSIEPQAARVEEHRAAKRRDHVRDDPDLRLEDVRLVVLVRRQHHLLAAAVLNSREEGDCARARTRARESAQCWRPRQCTLANRAQGSSALKKQQRQVP